MRSKAKKILNKVKPVLFFQLQLFPSPPGGKDWSQLELWDLSEMLHLVINSFLALLGAYALIAIIWGAYQYLTAYGNEEKAQKGKSIVLYAVIGVVIAVLAWIFVNAVWYIITGEKAP